MAEFGKTPPLELEPAQPGEIGRAIAGLLAPERAAGATWWRAGIDSALAQSRGGAVAPLRKSRGTDRA
jgi:hypothetical protein